MSSDGREWINVVVGMVLVGLGLLFLVAQLFNVNVMHFTWPFFIIVPGLLFFVGMMLGGKGAGGLAIPGSIITTVGLILLYQNSFNHWQSWAYAWALIFPTSVGFGIMTMGAWSDQPSAYWHGKRMAGWGIAIFAAGLIFFEFILNISGFGYSLMGKIAGPAILIASGLYLIIRRATLAARSRKPAMPMDCEAPTPQIANTVRNSIPPGDAQPPSSTGTTPTS
ncbi:MAG: hypothetical protein ACOX87_01085 [Chloroflexota bacterium]